MCENSISHGHQGVWRKKNKWRYFLLALICSSPAVKAQVMCSSTSPSSMAVVQHMMAWQTWSQMVHLGAPEAACWQDTHITQENTVMFCFRFRHADQTPSLGPRLYKYHWYALWVSGRFFIKLSLSFFLFFLCWERWICSGFTAVVNEVLLSLIVLNVLKSDLQNICCSMLQKENKILAVCSTF